MGLLDGKVVLVTGAGGGIGRCHALACAREGARVVVNDLGGARDGSGAGSRMADQVVAEIAELGSEAVANYDSVTDFEGCERMVQAALDAWGRLDVVVNNAGILRDKSFAKMSPEEWDLVIEVHLTGTRNVTRAALDALKADGGALINTTSYSGMIGNFGQSNYAAAKAGIYGFTRVMALELRKYGVTANCVAPVAKTRMTDDIDMVADEWGPEQISPIVTFLASDLAKGVTGQVFGVQGQRIHLYEVKTNEGVEKEGTALWTATEIGERLSEITAWAQPAAADAGEGDLVSTVFSFIPEGFKPGAAPLWKANIQWVVDGGTDQTIIVENDACRTVSGLQGSPTCTVKIGRDTLIGLFSGELDATKVFMTGKAQADNMGDLMKLGMAFDFGKVAAAYKASTAAPAEEYDYVTGVFSYFPSGFKAGAVPNWTANLQWVVDGGTDQTIVIAGDVCTVHAGLEGSPTCTVKIGKETLIALFKGEVEPAKVFMTGLATADNMGELMKLAMAFDFKQVGAAFLTDHPDPANPTAATPAEPEAERVIPLGKRYEGGYWQIDRAEIAAYAAATDDHNDAYQGADAVASPMYHVKPFIGLMMKLATDPALDNDILRLVHGEHSMHFHRPMRHGDVLQLRGTLESYDVKSSGKVVAYGLFGFVDGELALEGRTSYFIRGEKKSEGPRKARPAPEPLPPESWSVAQPVSLDQADRYAVASGDDNPIHTKPETAKSAGLPGCILHGLCSMAFATRDLVDHYCDGDPSRLASVSVRFAKPVFPGETLTLKVWEHGGGQLSFNTENADGKVVISNGTAVIRS